MAKIHVGKNIINQGKVLISKLPGQAKAMRPIKPTVSGKPRKTAANNLAHMLVFSLRWFDLLAATLLCIATPCRNVWQSHTHKHERRQCRINAWPLAQCLNRTHHRSHQTQQRHAQTMFGVTTMQPWCKRLVLGAGIKSQARSHAQKHVYQGEQNNPHHQRYSNSSPKVRGVPKRASLRGSQK